jgi:tetratricopeptide (TPR) repeat protein
MISPVVILVVVTLTLMFLSAWWILADPEASSLAQVNRAESLWELQPEVALRLCQGALNQLTRRLERKRLSPKGLEGLVRARLLLAMIEQCTGKSAAARDHLANLRKLPLEAALLERQLLRFYLTVDSGSTEAFQTYLACCRSLWLNKDIDQRERCLNALRACCEVQRDMAEVELVERVKRNQDARKVFPTDAWPMRGEALAWARLKKHQRALAVLEDLVVYFPDSIPDRIVLVRELIARGNKERARAQLEILETQAPNNYEVLLDVARLQVLLGDIDLASDNLKRVFAAAPHLQARARSLVGVVLLRKGMPAKAIDPLQKALAAEPENTETRLALAEALSQTGAADQAIQVLSPTGQQALPAEQEFALACALCNVQRWSEAAEHFERCKESARLAARCALLRLRCLLQAGDPGVPQALKEAEVLNPRHVELAFYHGVLLYQAGSYQKALPHFVRAFNAANKTKDLILLKRAKRNVAACYWRMAGQHAGQEKYAEAAKAYEVLRKNLPTRFAGQSALLQTLAQCYFRAGLRRFRRGGPKAAVEAMEPVRRSVELLPEKTARSFLASLHFREGRYTEAASQYAGLLKEGPAEEAVQFAHALSALRAGAPGQAADALQRLSRGGGAYALRSALALSASHADRAEYANAIGILMAALKAVQGARDPYQDDACRNAVLYALRTGDAAWAKRLAFELFAGGNAGSPSARGGNLMLGCLLVDGGDYDQALPYLEQAVEETRGKGAQSGGVGQLLRQVYRRAAHQRAQKQDFAALNELLERALRRQDDADLKELQKLAQTASQSGALGDEPDDQVVRQLDDLHRSSAQPDVGLVRSAMVVHHRRACSLSRSGQHRPARDHWREAHQIWVRQVARRPAFWKDYLASYNAGKQYQVQMNETDLETALQRRMAGLCIVRAGQSIEQQDYDEAQFFWDEACKVAPQAVCTELFHEVVDVREMSARLNLRTNPQALVRLYRFLYDKIDPCEEYRKELEQLQIVEAVDAIKKGDLAAARQFGRTANADMRKILVNVAVDQAIQAFKAGNFSQCHNLLAFAGEYDSDWVRLGGRVRGMSNEVLRAILGAFQVHPLIRVLAQANPDKADIALFQIVMSYAEFNTKVPGGLRPQIVYDTVQKVIDAVLEDMLKR